MDFFGIYYSNIFHWHCMPKKKRIKAVPAAKQAVWAGPGTDEGSDGAVSYEALTIDGEMFQVNSFVFLQVG